MIENAAARTIHGVDELRAATGQELGVSPWYDVTQDRIDAFAEVSGDRYWIHVNPERAAASEIGSTIAHGLFTLSLGPMLMESIVAFDGFPRMLNYGYDRVRFAAPVPVGSRVRMRLAVHGLTDAAQAVRATLLQTFERDGTAKPVCIATSILHLGTA